MEAPAAIVAVAGVTSIQFIPVPVAAAMLLNAVYVIVEIIKNKSIVDANLLGVLFLFILYPNP
jgi:hypothetical protein